MEPFLHKLANHLHRKYQDELQDCCILFPNRRAGLFFKKYYASLKEDPGFMPVIMTIGDLMNQLSGLQAADPLELSFRIYRSYVKHTSNPESYDDFYPWGDMLIADFNDVDRYMVNPAALFKNITDLKNIDSVFDFLDESQKELIKRFWNSFNFNKLSEHQESFITIWKLLQPVYEDFRNELLKDKLGYEGMIYRKVAEETILDPSYSLPWKKVVICGFNALSNSEERLFLFLRNNSLADFYWDYDLEYIKDDIQEAGRFLRRNIRLFPADPGFDPGFDNLKNKASVHVYSLPSDVLQAKKLCSVLNVDGEGNLGGTETGDENSFNKTSVIFGDESLLPAVLSSLPDSLEYLNITMGFPVSQTPVFSFVDAILSLHRYSEKKKKDLRFYYKDVLGIIEHQYIKSFYSEKTIPLVEDIHTFNKLYLSPENFKGDQLLEFIFRRLSGVEEIITYLSILFQQIMNSFPAEDPGFKLEKEYIFLINTRLNKLRNLLDEHSFSLSMDGFIRLFRRVLLDFKIPFEGEPLRGTQCMGILESRLLDFQNVVFLSMNEGIIPSASGNNSFIPSNLRFAFGLPVKEDKDAIYAYYFYRLLQRAENIHILYNSTADGGRSGEPSRYISQLEYLSGWDIQKHTTSFLVHERKAVPISIKKGEEVLNALRQFSDPGSAKYMSPSALTTWLDCGLRFYFSYIAGIREEDEVSEEIDASGFGSLYHKAMELIYEDFKGSMITSETIDHCIMPENLERVVQRAFQEEFHKDHSSGKKIAPEGKNIIVVEIIRKMVLRTLEIDKGFAPFKLHDLEMHIQNKEVHLEGVGNVRLGGKIDRLDQRGDSLYVIDYKTGKASLEFPTLETVFSRELWKSQDFFKGIFQTFLYSWLYSGENPETKKLTPAIYLTKELFSENFNIYLKDKGLGAFISDFSVYMPEFEDRLRSLLREIFDPLTDFSQTLDEKRCLYCPYKDICHREDRG